ncbi:MAG: hypothetical protein ABIT37_00095 [Luteolibacter sp.]
MHSFKTPALFVIAVLLGGLAVWSFNRKEHVAALAAATRTGTPAATTRHTSPAKVDDDDDPAPARPARTADAEQEKLNKTLRENVVINLGKVEDIGRQAASMMTTRKELKALRAIASADRTPEQSARLLALERQHAVALGMVSEISSFQNNPDEYGRFFSSLLQQSGGLDDTRTAGVNQYMRGRSEAMIAAGFNAANEPADPAKAAEWETRRDAFNTATADGVAALLPPGKADEIGFTAGFLEMMEQDFDKADAP